MVGRFYEELADRLVASALRVFEGAGAQGVDVFDVPGAFELRFAAQAAARPGTRRAPPRAARRRAPPRAIASRWSSRGSTRTSPTA